ncbi:MAG: citrate transporter [Clostridia bacterium]|nr:citrate transporter [Clostridia bacterium]
MNGKSILTLPYRFFHKNPILCLAFLLAVASAFFVPPDGAYAGYFDFNTLTCLFCTLAVVCALQDAHFFTILAERLVRLTGTLRMAVLSLIVITFLGSMVLANDMALLTFLPLGLTVLRSTDNMKYLAPVFILQNISANLGGMLTPFGNPQNLYLYSHFEIPAGEFVQIMFPPFLMAVILLTVCAFCFPARRLILKVQTPGKLMTRKNIFFLILFAFSVAIVFRFFPYWVGLISVPVCLFFTDRKALGEVDYGLLMTFVCFFVFAGNLSRIDAVREFLSSLLAKNPLLVSIASCQVISNVPSAVLLSNFTTDYAPLLVGVNLGGAGTLIASLASLITFRKYRKYAPGNTVRYTLLFSAFNFGFLLLLTAAEYFILYG